MPNDEKNSVFGPHPLMTPRYAYSDNTNVGYIHTVANLSLVTYGGTKWSPKAYLEFILTQADHALDEHVHVVQGLSDEIGTYAFGATPPTFTYAGVLLNDKENDQVRRFQRLYWSTLRASEASKKNVEVVLSYDHKLVYGTMLSFSWSLNANDESACPFQFALLVRSIAFAPNNGQEAGDQNYVSPPPLQSIPNPAGPQGADLAESPYFVVTSGVRNIVAPAEAPAEKRKEASKQTPAKPADAVAALRRQAEAREADLAAKRANARAHPLLHRNVF